MYHKKREKKDAKKKEKLSESRISKVENVYVNRLILPVGSSADKLPSLSASSSQMKSSISSLFPISSSSNNKRALVRGREGLSSKRNLARSFATEAGDTEQKDRSQR